MKAGPATRTMVLTGLLVLVLTLADGPTQVSSHPAPEWVNFLSANTTFLGEPVPVDAVIVAFDPQGVQCGEFTVVEEGKYGFLPCYRDDDTTPEDDGADPGDVISFTINGLPAEALGPDDPIWTSHGDRRVVDLHVAATPPPPVPAGGYIVPVSKPKLLAPWLGLPALALLAALTVTLGRRRRA